MAFELVRPSKLDDSLLRIVSTIVDQLNRGISNEEVRGGAGITVDKLKVRVTEQIVVQTTRTKFPHGLGKAPVSALISMYSAGTIWHDRDPDSVFLYLIADAANRKARVRVEG